MTYANDTWTDFQHMHGSAIRIYCEACLAHNPTVIEAFAALDQSSLPRRSHYINGRFENLYVDPGHLPGLQSILDHILALSARQSGHDSFALRLGFWLNAMQPGDSTSLHSHDDNYELLSGVYYLDVPADSGDLVLHYGDSKERVIPQAGLLVLFAPDVPHEVTSNQSDRLRLSLGFNIGPSGSV